jgi:hypothetical protein
MTGGTMKKIIVLIYLAGCALTLPAPALAANEFSKVGNNVQIKGEGIALEVPGMYVACESTKSNGRVASSTELQSKVLPEKCNSTFGTTSKASAKVTACNLTLYSQDKATLEGGCKVESEGCVIEPSSTANKQLVETGFRDLKEEEKGGIQLEAELNLNLRGITYEATGMCKTLGVEKGKEGALVSVTSLILLGADLPPTRFVRVESANVETITFTLTNNTDQVFLFPGGKTMTCGGAVFTGKTTALAERLVSLSFTTLTFANCKTNILNMTEESVEMEAVGANCAYILGPFDGDLTFPNVPQPSGGNLFVNACEVKGQIKNQTCVVTFPGNQWQDGIGMLNVAGPPGKIVVFFTQRMKEPYTLRYTSAGCGAGFQAGGRATYKGESKLNAKNGVNTAKAIEIV